jgi:hypothetical protein
VLHYTESMDLACVFLCFQRKFPEPMMYSVPLSYYLWTVVYSSKKLSSVHLFSDEVVRTDKELTKRSNLFIADN